MHHGNRAHRGQLFYSNQPVEYTVNSSLSVHASPAVCFRYSFWNLQAFDFQAFSLKFHFAELPCSPRRHRLHVNHSHKDY